MDTRNEISSGIVDPKDLISKYTPDELAEAAEGYFARLDDHWYHIVKPFASPDEAPDNLASFGALIAALELKKGDRVLDFASGSCWTSRFLAQMGCGVISTDLSPTALSIGRSALKKLPLLPPHGTIDFIPFNGYRLDLPDESVNRVACLDAFHHVVNQADVLQEIFRVLTPGGIFAMSEPGPNHSRTAQSQFEMKNYKVIEQDIVVDQINRLAQDVGYQDCEVALYGARPHFVPVADFEKKLGVDNEFLGSVIRTYLYNHRLIRMRKPGTENKDSRTRVHLAASLSVVLRGKVVVVTILNTGEGRWLRSGTNSGCVNLGLHTIGPDGSVVDLDFRRFHFLESDLDPRQTETFEFEIDDWPPGIDEMELDLVAEHVSWFATVGNRAIRLFRDVGGQVRIR